MSKSNHDVLLQWFPDNQSVAEAIRLIESGSDTEPYLSNRLIRICMLLKKSKSPKSGEDGSV